MTEEMITINGMECRVKPGRTIWETARDNGIEIPTLCLLKDAAPTGACRICLVEVEGMNNLAASCSTPAQAGMVIWTESKKVIAARKEILSLMLASGNHNCGIGSTTNDDWTEYQLSAEKYDKEEELCPAWGDCRLQDLAYRYGVKTDDAARVPARYPKETVNPLIVRDFSRCILCGRCVQACNDIQVNRAIHIGYRGTDSKIVAGTDVPLKDSDCVFCGECIQACPTGALVEKKSLTSWRPWEEKKIRTTCPYCGVGCQLWLHVCDGKIAKVTGVEDGSPNKGRLCVKGRFGFDFIYSGERLTTPLIKENGTFRRAEWKEALDLVAEKFKSIIKESGPDALAGVSCARSINEDSYQMQKLFRAVFKTNNIDHCART